MGMRREGETAVFRLLALAAVVVVAPSAAFAEPPASASASARSVPAQAAPAATRAPPPARTQKPAHRIVAAHLREMQAFEYRPARDYEAQAEGFGVRDKRIGFFRSF